MFPLHLERNILDLPRGDLRNVLRKTLAFGLRRLAPRKTGFPYILTVEVTNDCILDCIMCPRKHIAKNLGYMKFELFEKIIAESSKSYFLGELLFSGFGEPLLHPHILNMIDLAKARGVPKVRLTTNAVLLTREVANKIISESGLDEIGISLDSLTPETYEKVKRCPSFVTVKDNILGFLEERRRLGQHKPFVNLHILKMKETHSEIDGFIREWEPLLGKGDRILVKYLHDVGGLVKNIALQERIRDLRRPCSQLWTLLLVSWNGDVVPCCVDPLRQLKIGTVETTPIKELWSNLSLQALRETHLQGDWNKIPICKSCGTWWYFGKKPKGLDS